MVQVIHDPDVVGGYLVDASNVAGTATGLVRPRHTDEVAEVVAHCAAEGIPLTVAGARTSTTGASVPDGGWVLSTERLVGIGEIGHDLAEAEAGVRLGDFQDAIEARGRLYPPDPTSRRDCTLGASIACNASGARTFKYGPTRPWVEAVDVVLPRGEVLRVRRGDPIPAGWPLPHWVEPKVKTAAGYAPPTSLVDLFVGQEGTLGVITRAVVRLTALPADVVGLVAWFRSRADATAFVATSRAAARADAQGPLSPRCLEYLDHRCLQLARKRVSVPDGAEVALFCEQEVGPEGADEHLGAWLDALAGAGALADDTLVAADEPTRQALHRFRHAIPAGINEEAVRRGMPKVGTDLAVPDDALDAMMALYESSPVEHVLFGHVGDNHLHLNLLPSDADELSSARAWYDELAREAIARGGTVSGEHGIGKHKKRHLAWMVGDEVLSSFRALKRHLDPAWILGRGNIVDPA